MLKLIYVANHKMDKDKDQKIYQATPNLQHNLLLIILVKLGLFSGTSGTAEQTRQRDTLPRFAMKFAAFDHGRYMDFRRS